MLTLTHIHMNVLVIHVHLLTHTCTCRYHKPTKRNSYTIQWEESFGAVNYYISIVAGEEVFHLGIVSPFTYTQTSCLPVNCTNNELRSYIDKTIVPVESTHDLVAVPISSFRRKCVYIEIGSTYYVSVIPNTYERD